MPTDELMVLVGQAREGNAAAFTELVLAVQREVRIELATYASSSVMLDAASDETWALCYRSLDLCPVSGSVVLWVQQLALSVIRRRVDEAVSMAKQSGDIVHLRVLEASRSALRGPDNANLRGVEQVARRFLGLSPVVQRLLNQRYGLRQRDAELARASGPSPEQLARTLCAARVALDWQDAPTTHWNPPFDMLTERVLADDKMGDKTRLAGMLDADAGLAIAFVRQARLDLVLHALLSPITREQARLLVSHLGVVDRTSKVTIGKGAPKRISSDVFSRPSGKLTSAARHPEGALRQAQGPPAGSRRQAGRIDGQRRPSPPPMMALLVTGALIMTAISAGAVLWLVGGKPAGSPEASATPVGDSGRQQGDRAESQARPPGPDTSGANRGTDTITSPAPAAKTGPIDSAADTPGTVSASKGGVPTAPAAAAVASAQVDYAAVRAHAAPAVETAIHPSSVRVTSSQPGCRPESIIDGSGLTFTNGKWVHTNNRWADSGSMWNSGYEPAGGLGQLNVTLDLGATRSIAGMLVWNYNEKGWQHRGAKDIEVSTSLNGTTFTKAEDFTLKQAAGEDGEEAQTVRLPVVMGARYIRILFISNHSTEPTSGLSEVAVLVTDPADTDRVLK